MGRATAPQFLQPHIPSSVPGNDAGAPRDPALARRGATVCRTAAAGETPRRTPQAARETRAQEDRLMLQLTLDDRWLAPLRRTLFGAQSGLISILRASPDPRDPHRIKVWLGLRRASVRAVMDLIITTLPEAEIGRIGPVSLA